MEFIHTPYQPGDTIAAVATPPGEGGIAIIRISGNDAVTISNKIFSGNVKTYSSHTAHLGHILDTQGRVVDEVLLLPMLGKKSYTGEDTVEIHCHGGRLITRRVLEVVLQAGARSAKPGEFTFKAFMNKKLDLTQAEAVQELIGAKNERALDIAEKQLQGGLSRKINFFQGRLVHIAAILEAWVDFPEEGLEFASMEELCEDLRSIHKKMHCFLSSFHNGKILHEGISLCLVGAPNVGKSSLMNTLFGKDRAIVTDIPGTTRDVLEDEMILNGLNVRLIDTAGIRDTQEFIEKEGIRRSKAAMQDADLVLFVLDIQKGLQDCDIAILENVSKDKTVAIWNKDDLKHNEIPRLDLPHVVQVSAIRKTGIEGLHKKIEEVIWKGEPPSKEEIPLTSMRHKEALSNAICSCEKLIEGLESSLSPEFLTFEIRHCLNELSKIVGRDISQDILTSIFSTFCIGK